MWCWGVLLQCFGNWWCRAQASFAVMFLDLAWPSITVSEVEHSLPLLLKAFEASASHAGEEPTLHRRAWLSRKALEGLASLAAAPGDGFRMALQHFTAMPKDRRASFIALCCGVMAAPQHLSEAAAAAIANAKPPPSLCHDMTLCLAGPLKPDKAALHSLWPSPGVIASWKVRKESLPSLPLVPPAQCALLPCHSLSLSLASTPCCLFHNC